MKLDNTLHEADQFEVCLLTDQLSVSLAERLRKITMEEQSIVETIQVNLRLSAFGEASNQPSGKDEPRKGKKKHEIPDKDRKLNDQLRAKLADKLNRDKSIIQEHTVKGLKLTRNERKKIIAAVSLAEGSFVSVNKDTEFEMSEKRAKQTNVSYYKVVHIGLSWGLIQFTQDSGNLGGLLLYMRNNDESKFESIFGDSSQDLLDVVNAIGVSGQHQWKKLQPSARKTYRQSGRDIRGPRVQPVSTSKNGVKMDIWEEPWLGRFKQAGLDEGFQELQLEYAIKQFINTNWVYSFCEKQEIQTALGLALVVDRAVQMGPQLAGQTIQKIARQTNITLPFTGPAQERRLAEYIASHPGNGFVTVDHARRVKLLLEDSFRLLTVSLYDWNTYGPTNDK